ncbi:Uncharacterised protein [Mycobacteroides abscessus subsp. bolletii]|uniref:hypothetical protein n=1 Tax=Mycobacteroides abscessus TaxID=36809 RepID=UPI0009A5E1AD|nr:hypothetical protein [Mycobacteroides abscessus]SKG69048.1 Uncharacterised protein [Mycobacteroides abscessus subsp. bolletii]SLF40425.1 Uncharacterised protein [Mycobacteroides abscessus subsp. bolletii]
MFLNSGYGFDEFDVDLFGITVVPWEQCARAQAITLIPTRAFDLPADEDHEGRIRPAAAPFRDLTFADLIRFEPFPDPWDAPHPDSGVKPISVNTGVHLGFACGANMRVPNKWLQLTDTQWEDNWLFLNLDQELRDYGSLGLYVALYRTTPHFAPHPPYSDQLDNIGFIYAAETSPLDFNTFRQHILTNNSGLPQQLSWDTRYQFHAPDDRKFDFYINTVDSKYTSRVWDWNPDREHDKPPELDTGRLVEGPYLNAPKNGHDGYNIADNHIAWAQRCEALRETAEFRKNYYPKEARAAMEERVAIYYELTQLHPATYEPLLQAAENDLTNW